MPHPEAEAMTQVLPDCLPLYLPHVQTAGGFSQICGTSDLYVAGICRGAE